ncbi:MAG: polysaccharide biosynthesis tyrosine autokinase [Deltaproteobacteria bacterium]
MAALTQYDINLREYWRILKKRKFIVVLTALFLGTFSTAFAILKAPAPIYTSVCNVKFERETTVEGLYTKTLTWSSGDDIETQISIMTSYSVLEKVAERLGLIPRRNIPEDSAIKGNVIRVIDELQSKVEVTRQEHTNILQVKVEDGNPLFAQRLANILAETYKEMHARNQMKRTTEAIKYIEDQLQSVRRKLTEAEEEFNQFSQDNQLLAIDLQSENHLARNQQLQDRIQGLQEAKIDIQRLIDRLDRFIGSPGSSGQSFYSTKADTQYQSVNNRLVELQLRRDSLLEEFTPQHPEVIAINRKISENARKMKLLLQMQARVVQKQEGDAKRELVDLDSKANALMETKLEYDRLKRKVNLYHDMTALLERKHQEALIKKAEKPEEVTIVKPALMPSQPINPPKTTKTGAMGIVIGLVLGMVAAFVVETFDTSLGAIEDVEQTLKTPVLGVIPQAEGKALQESLKENFPEGVENLSSLQRANLISHFAPKSMVSESFRALRTNIQFKDVENNVKAIAITSASPQEGKTFVSINLAITMAQAGIKTLLIGSDMRKPMIDRAFGIEMSPGLSEILLGNFSWRETVKNISDILVGKMGLDQVLFTPGLDNLHIITSGTMPPNPAELIESKRLREFLEEAKEEYDLIIFDSPPILSTADAAILGSKVDGVLLAYRVGTVSRGLLKRCTSQLQQVKCNILGVILNGLKPEVSPDFQDFKYYKHYYSYGDHEVQEKSSKGRRSFLLFGAKNRGFQGGEPGMHLGSLNRKNRSKRISPSRSVLIVMALALLAGGLLWQNGVIEPFALFGSDKKRDRQFEKPVIKRRLQPQTSQRSKARAKTEAARPEGGRNTKHGSEAPALSVAPVEAKTAGLSGAAVRQRETPGPQEGKVEAGTPENKAPVKQNQASQERASAKKTAQIEERKGTDAVVANAVKSYLAEEVLDKTEPGSAAATTATEKTEKEEDRRKPHGPTPASAQVKPLKVEPLKDSGLSAQRTAPVQKETPAAKKEEVSDQVVRDAVRSFLEKEGLAPTKPSTHAPVPAQKRPSRSSKFKVAAPGKPPSFPFLDAYPYSLYLGSFRNLDRAKEAMALHSEKGLSPYWVRVDLKDKGLWFRIFCGHFGSHEQAEKFAREHALKEASVKKTPYANLLGSYSQGTELQDEIKKLSALGFSPYVVQGQGGQLRLLVGAYVTEKGAESQRDNLRSHGIDTQVVKR